MNKELLFHRETLHVRGYDVTKNRKASIPAIIQMMHEAAMQHVMRLEVSATHLATHDLGWALHQQSLAVFQQPTLGDRLQVLTHPSGMEKLLTYRDFHLFDDKGKLLAKASTSWFLMNLRRRRIARYPDFIDAIIRPSNKLDHLPRPVAPDPGMETPTVEAGFQVRFHDLDFNGHLSNYHYAKWMLDTLPTSWLENNRLESFDIQFLAECLLDDTVRVEVWPKDADTYVHHMTKDEKSIARGTTRWKPL